MDTTTTALFASLKTSLVEIFQIVGNTPAQAQEYADLMIQNSFISALSLLIQKDSGLKKDFEAFSAGKDAPTSEDTANLLNAIQEKIPTVELNNAIAEASEKLFQAYFATILPKLTPEQKNSIQDIIQKLSTH